MYLYTRQLGIEMCTYVSMLYRPMASSSGIKIVRKTIIVKSYCQYLLICDKQRSTQISSCQNEGRHVS